MNEVRANSRWRGDTFGLPFPCYVASDPVERGTLGSTRPRCEHACVDAWNDSGTQTDANAGGAVSGQRILAEGAIALSVTLSGGALFAS